MKKYFLISFIVLIINNYLFADYDYRDNLILQLNNYKLDISKINSKIQELILKSRETDRKLKQINDSITFLSTIVDKFNTTDPKSKIFRSEAELITTKEKIDKLKAEFKKRILWLYKHGQDYDAQILFSSKSFNDFYIRLEYLNKISGMRKKDFDRINQEFLILEEKKKLNVLNREELRKYIADKKAAQKTLLDEKNLIEKEIKNIREENEMLNRQIERKNNFIAEIERYLFYNATGIKYKIDQTVTYSGIMFSEIKGKMIFPVQSVTIIQDFGRIVNNQTRTLSNNNGIDVSIAENSEVKCVADGIVEDIFTLPYFGNIIIINHSNGYKTIYSVIKDITIRLNQKVSAGSVIAKTSQNLNGQCFHFEIRKDNSPLDPKIWVKRGAIIN